MPIARTGAATFCVQTLGDGGAGPALDVASAVLGSYGWHLDTLARYRSAARGLDTPYMGAQETPATVVELAATLAGDGAISATLTTGKLLAATLAGDGSASAALLTIKPLAALLAGDGSLTATMSVARLLAVSAAGDASFSATLTNLSGPVALAATFRGDATINATLTVIPIQPHRTRSSPHIRRRY